MNQNTIRLDSVAEPFFRDAIERYVELHCAHYGERLAAIYVEGSVHRNEAIPGVSDLDTYVFIEGARNENDHSWQQQTQERLRREIPGFHVVSDAVSVEEAFPPEWVVDAAAEDEVFRWQLRKRWYRDNPTEDDEENARRQLDITNGELAQRSRVLLTFGRRARELRYDATLVWGRDVVAGMEIPPWNWLWTQAYRAYFAMPHELVRYAAGLQPENTTPFSLPDSQPMRLRKLARVGVLGSAALLMQSGEFKSFKAADVLPPLQQRFPQWADFLEETRVLAVCLAVATDERLSAYTANLVAWFDWVQQHLRDGCCNGERNDGEWSSGLHVAAAGSSLPPVPST